MDRESRDITTRAGISPRNQQVKIYACVCSDVEPRLQSALAKRFGKALW
jgi:hypothetical protein